MVKSAVFVLGGMHRDVGRTGDAIAPNEIDLLQQVATELRLEVDLFLAVEDPAQAGKGSSVPMNVIREERPRLIEQIERANPDIVVCFGPTAIKSVFNKGNMVQREMMRQKHNAPDVACPVVVTHSMEALAMSPGIKKWIRMDIQAAVEGHVETEWGDYVYIRSDDPSWSVAPDWVHGLQPGVCIGFDLETYPGLDPHAENSRIRMAVLSHMVGRATVVLTDPYGALPEWVTTLASDNSIIKAGSNIKFDYRWMHRFGYDLRNLHDTSTADHVLDETNPFKDLKSLTFKYLPRLGDYSKDQRARVAELGGWEHVPDDEMLQYAGGDGEASLAAAHAQRRILREHNLERPFRLSMDLYEVLAKMEVRGVGIDMGINKELDASFSDNLSEVRDKITDALGPINPNSPVQLADALLRTVPDIDLAKRGLRHYLEERPTEEASTARDVLEREASKHPVIEDILLHRRLQKLHGTYIKGIRDKYITERNGKYYIHPQYRTDVVHTNRLSSNSPNGQNIPRKPDPDDPHPIPQELNIKRQFVSRFDGGQIMEADLSQAELRVAAWLSRDPNMIGIIEHGGDIHRNTASLVYGVPLDEVTDLQRYNCKRVNFLTLYGGGANTLGRQLGISKNQAKEILDQYFRTFPGLRTYIDRINVRVQRDLYVESPFGYRRRFERPLRWMSWDGWRVQRQAWNHIVQNTAAALCYVGMINVQGYLEDTLKSHIIMQVHDSIIVDVYPGELDHVATITKAYMEEPSLDRYGVDNFDIPLVCDVEAGPSWGEMKPIAFE
ncbi:MAG: hypothetical protein AMJ55_00280 [Gammaproteobacteria bacterium SG8_15]|nr:MAG: hypothetical protein AMJ55_00280 [Gammaproteobacteria bacterium SG8_15]